MNYNNVSNSKLSFLKKHGEEQPTKLDAPNVTSRLNRGFCIDGIKQAEPACLTIFDLQELFKISHSIESLDSP